MKKSTIIILILVTIFTIFIGCDYYKGENVYINIDALNFKKEYESLNNEVSSNNKDYIDVEIPSNNVIKYTNYDEIFNILENGTGIIYLGYPECPWCRNLVPVLLEAAGESEVDKIYYFNIKEERNLLSLDENNQIITEKEGTKEYKQLVKKLSDILDNYILTDSNGALVDTGEKRIYVPIVVFIKDGKILDYHVDTVETQTDPYVPLNDREKEELLVKLINLCGLVKGSICDERC